MSFEVKCAVEGDQVSIEVPTDCSVSDVLKKASEHSGVTGVSLWYCDVQLNFGHLFADYFEPETVYYVKVGGNFPDGTLLDSNETKLKLIGVTPIAPELLMEVSELEWSMDEFVKKAGNFAPTLVLIKMKNGTECGGVAGVPWPEKKMVAADPAKGSFIFSLGATPTRFDLVKPEHALYRDGLMVEFGYGSNDLFILNDGSGCCSREQGAYAGPRGKGQLVGGTADFWIQKYERWELWRL
jgi:hypothetical protein